MGCRVRRTAQARGLTASVGGAQVAHRVLALDLQHPGLPRGAVARKEAARDACADERSDVGRQLVDSEVHGQRRKGEAEEDAEERERDAQGFGLVCGVVLKDGVTPEAAKRKQVELLR